MTAVKVYLAPGTGEPPPPPPPSLSVTEGSIGTEITITGSGFGDKKGKVLIGDVVTKQAVATKIAKYGWTDRIYYVHRKESPRWITGHLFYNSENQVRRNYFFHLHKTPLLRKTSKRRFICQSIMASQGMKFL